jgi:hypothetical protein
MADGVIFLYRAAIQRRKIKAEKKDTECNLSSQQNTDV